MGCSRFFSRNDSIRSIFAGGGYLFGFSRTAETQTVVYSAAERLWVRVTPLLRHREGRRIARVALGLIDPGVQQAVISLLDDPRLAVTGHMTPRTVRRLAPFFLSNYCIK